MASLDALIKELEKLFQAKSTHAAAYLAFVRSPSELLDILREIQSLVGLEVFKESIAKQFKFFALNYRDYGTPVRDDLLNVVFYGPPGAGKTECGRLLSKFWIACSCLDSTTASSAQKIPRSLFDMTLPGIIPTREDVVEFLGDRSGIRDIARPVEKREFQIYTRGDFVGNYQGWSAAKTRGIIEKNMGNVIMIDEAYTLILDEKDAYGNEAAAEILNFMDKHPTKIRWIFAGYRNELEKGLFSFQPGFKRRFNWFVSMLPYNSKELAHIFHQQMGKKGWKCSDADVHKVAQLIEKNLSLFEHNGGSTKKLAYTTESTLIEMSWDEFIHNPAYKLTRIYTAKDVSRALEEYKKMHEEDVKTGEYSHMYA